MAVFSRATPEEKALRDADKDYRQRVKAAEKALSTAEEGVLVEQYAKVRLYGDRIVNGSDEVLLKPETTADVTATGTVTKVKDKTVDSRELYLTVEHPGAGLTIKCKPDDGEKVRQLAQKIRVTAPTAPAAATARAEATKVARRELEAVRADRADVTAAEAALQPGDITRVRRRQRFAWVKWAAAGIVGLILLVAIFGSSGDDEGPAAPAATVEAVSEPDTEAAEPVEPVDTGRMSDGEYDQLKLFTSSFTKEADDFLQGVGGRCTALAGAQELAAAADCYDKAYDGVEGKAGAAYSVYTDLIKSTDKTCRKWLRRLRSTLDRFATAMDNAHDLGSNLSNDVAAGTLIGKRLRASSETMVVRYATTLDRCEPA